jgi:hypothetical protein
MVYGIIAAVLVVAAVLCVGGGLAFSSFFGLVNHSLSTSLASFTVNEFCLDEETHDYTSAYSLLSTNLQQQVSESQFISDGQQHDSELGPISMCTQQGSLVSTSGNVKLATVNITRMLTPTPDATGSAPSPQPNTYSGQVTLVDEASQWRVDQVDSALNML